MKSAKKKQIGLSSLLFLAVSSITLVILISTAVIGYNTAKNELDLKGELILQNAVTWVAAVIDQNQKLVDHHHLTETEAKRYVLDLMKQELVCDLGENGYFIILNSKGDILLHPQLEGMNAWDFRDLSPRRTYFAQEQIATAKSGGGFTYFKWTFPDSDQIGDKVTYSLYDPEWDWVIESSSYAIDYNKSAMNVLKNLIWGIVFINVFALILMRQIITTITQPLWLVINAMKSIGQGQLPLIAFKSSNAETDLLISGYNELSMKLKIAFSELQDKNSKLLESNIEIQCLLKTAKMSELKYSGLIEGLEDAVYSLDANNLIVANNRRFLDQMELPFEVFRGLDYTQWTIPGLADPESYRHFWFSALDTVKSNKAPFTGELSYQLASSSSMTVMEVRLIPIVNEMGEVELIIGSNRNVTELALTRKQIHDFLEHENEHLEMLIEIKSKELKEATQELYRSERLASLGRLVAGVAHEINTPLGVALTGSSYLVRTNENAFKDLRSGQFTLDRLPEYMESVNEASEIISRNLNRAAKLVSNFRDIAETESHDLLSRFSLSEHLNAMILSLYHEYRNKRVTINNLLKEDMIIYGQPSHYTQIMTNLLMNSLIHGYREDDELLITIEGEISDKQLQLIYKDTGKGIPQENMPKIFEPFFTTARHRGGTGLGLSLIYNIVSERLGGSIHCNSTAVEGTQFIIKIPLEQDFWMT